MDGKDPAFQGAAVTEKEDLVARADLHRQPQK
jgi:hypothetical protein